MNSIEKGARSTIKLCSIEGFIFVLVVRKVFLDAQKDAFLRLPFLVYIFSSIERIIVVAVTVYI